MGGTVPLGDGAVRCRWPRAEVHRQSGRREIRRLSPQGRQARQGWEVSNDHGQVVDFTNRWGGPTRAVVLATFECLPGRSQRGCSALSAGPQPAWRSDPCSVRVLGRERDRPSRRRRHHPRPLGRRAPAHPVGPGPAWCRPRLRRGRHRGRRRHRGHAHKPARGRTADLRTGFRLCQRPSVPLITPAP